KKSRILSLELKSARVPADFLKQIFAVGIPAAIVNIMTALSTVFINQFLLPYGDDKIAAMGIATKVSTIIQLILTGLTFGGQPVFGYLFGAKDRERLRRLLKFCVAFISIVAVVLTGIIVAAAPGLMRIFMDDTNVISAGIPMLRWRVISMLFVGIIMLTMILFQAFGKGSGALILSVSRQGVIFLAVLLTARAVLGYSGIVASQAISDLITAAIAVFLFFKMLWKEFRI
ncbi:MAG: MATE family efflux transporter, partial [Lachnospiraceae bacterium]|nr:MATE family efflux transporter [Lachnospiraceae bacterium]